jgi:hypothetical protein
LSNFPTFLNSLCNIFILHAFLFIVFWNPPTDSKATPTLASAAASAATEQRVLELEQELESVRAQKRELMQLQQQDKTTSVCLSET